MNIKNTYFGFTDKLKPMQKQRIEDNLNGLIRYNDEVMTKKEYLYKKLLEGGIPKIIEDVTYWSRKLQEYTKPKTEYHLNNLNNTYNDITKTEYDYAKYLIENDFIKEEKAINFITEEQLKLEQKKKQQEEQEAKEKAEKEEKEKQQEDFKSWLDNEIIQYNNEEKYNIAREIFLDGVGQYSEYQLKKLLVMIENIDNPLCKEKLKEWLHSHNTTSKKVFFHITGIHLPSTDKTTLPLLDIISTKDFTGIIQYKRKIEKVEKTEVEQKTFYKYSFDSQENKYIFQESRGEYVRKYELDLYITKVNNYYTITEGKTGLAVGNGNTKKEAYNKLSELIEVNTLEGVKERIQNFIDNHGISPLYQKEIAI